MKTYTFSEAKLGGVEILGNFGPDNFLTTDVDNLSDLRFLKIGRNMDNGPINGCRVSVPATATGHIVLRFALSGSSFQVGRKTRCKITIGFWRNSNVTIGDHTTMNDCVVHADNSDIEIGEDCMFSDGPVRIEGSDAHGIIDLETGVILNTRRLKVDIRQHVWLGRQTSVMPGVTIGEGAVVAAGARVTADVPPVSIAAGVPARILKQQRSWTRSPISATPSELSFFEKMGFPIQQVQIS